MGSHAPYAAPHAADVPRGRRLRSPLDGRGASVGDGSCLFTFFFPPTYYRVRRAYIMKTAARRRTWFITYRGWLSITCSEIEWATFRRARESRARISDIQTLRGVVVLRSPLTFRFRCRGRIERGYSVQRSLSGWDLVSYRVISARWLFGRSARSHLSQTARNKTSQAWLL